MGPLSRPPVMLAMIIAGAIAAYFIATGTIDLLAPYDFNPWVMIGLGLIIGLVLFTLVLKNAARITVPAILILAVVCLLLGFSSGAEGATLIINLEP